MLPGLAASRFLRGPEPVRWGPGLALCSLRVLWMGK